MDMVVPVISHGTVPGMRDVHLLMILWYLSGNQMRESSMAPVVAPGMAMATVDSTEIPLGY